MNRTPRRSLLVLLLCLLLGTAGSSQTITRVTPEIGEPGDLVIISGNLLAATGFVRFGALVGGFGGFWTIDAPVLTVSATTVTAIVPTFGNFLPPGIPNGSSPFGTVQVGPGFSNTLAFFYVEQTAGQVGTPGLGTTQGGLLGRPVIGFQITGGAPVLNNPSFKLTLENATPTATAILVAGSPATQPGLPYLDGFVGLNLLQPILFGQTPYLIDTAGDTVLPLPIPPGPLNITIAVMWAVVDPITGQVGISNALKVTL